MRYTILVILFFPLISVADQIQKRDRELLLQKNRDEKISLEEVYKFPEVYEYNSRLLKDLNSSSGLYSDTYYTRYDTGRFSLNYDAAFDFDNFSNIQGLALQYARSFKDSYRDFWWGLQFKYTTAQIEAINDNISSEEEDTQDFSFFGFGFGHQFYNIGKLFDSDRVFEIVTVHLNYVLHTDQLNQENYTGFGYNADYSLNYRLSKDYYYGIRLSYNWVFVERPQEESEPLTDRSKVFGWTTMGFELGYLF